MSCCDKTPNWIVYVGEGLDRKEYFIQVERQPTWCTETYKLFVNDHELNHTLYFNGCSPFCGRGGSYEWDQDGHHFQLVLDKCSYTDCLGALILFVDGFEVKTGREFSAYWRRKGWCLLVSALVYIVIGVVIYVVVFAVVKAGANQLGSMNGVNWLIVFGIMHFIFAVILFVKFKRSKCVPSATIKYGGMDTNNAKIV